MSDQSQGGRRAGRREFRPTLDGTLEPRLLLSAARVSIRATSQNIRYQIARNGQVAMITDTDGELYNVNVVGGGTVRAQAMSRGRVRLIVEKTNTGSILSINPVRPKTQGGQAHVYPASSLTPGDRLLHVGEIRVKTGQIGQILGYRTAELSGPILVRSTASVSRIALFSINPGGGISTAGDLDTLDVFNDLTLAGGTSIEVGRDLNLLSVGGNLSVSDGSNISVARDIGLVSQPAKGSASGGAGGAVSGNMTISPGGRFVIGRALQATFLIQGQLVGASQITGPDLVTPPVGAQNFVALGGIFA